MKKDSVLHLKLAEAGADSAMISQYQQYQDIGDRQGQERLLNRCCRMKYEELNKERDKTLPMLRKREYTHQRHR